MTVCLKKIEKRPNIAYEIQEDQVIAGLVAQGFGIAVVALHGGAAAAECQNHPDFLPLLGAKFLYGNPQGQISSPCGTEI